MKMLHKNYLLLALLFLACFQVEAQRDKERIKAQIAIGVNNPIDDGENDGYFTKYVNFPTVNLGMQYLFSEQWGAKLDFGFNRSSEADGSLEFKLNYTRINVQAVYNFAQLLTFLPERLEIVGHAGPGVSFTKPLGNFSENTYTYLNMLGGFEFHYRLSETMTVFTDLGYVYSLAGEDTYDLNVDGFSFNGDLAYLTFGVSFSLSGCRYC